MMQLACMCDLQVLNKDTLIRSLLDNNNPLRLSTHPLTGTSERSQSEQHSNCSPAVKLNPCDGGEK